MRRLLLAILALGVAAAVGGWVLTAPRTLAAADIAAAALDPRIKVAWRGSNGHISAASNTADFSVTFAPFFCKSDRALTQ